MKQLVPEIKIYGGSLDNVQGCTNKVENGDKLSLGDHINILSLHTPWYWLHRIFFNLLDSHYSFSSNVSIHDIFISLSFFLSFFFYLPQHS